jgi:putative ABC transport system permease protein
MNKLHALAEGLRIAWVALNANRIRSSLTILGVAIGVGVVVLMAALVTGIRSNVIEGFEAAGPENLFITRFDLSEVRLVNDGSQRPPWWNTRKITVAEVERVRRLPGVRAAEISFAFQSQMNFEGQRVTNVQSSAASLGWPTHTTGEIVAGRSFVPVEIEQGRPVVVLSVPLAEELFGQRDPIGKRVQVMQRGETDHFQVIGVFDPGDNIFAAAARHFAIFPHTAATRRLKASDEFLEVVVVPAAGYTREETQDQVIGTMRAMRGLGPSDDNTFAIIRSDQLVEIFDRFTAVFFVIMLALSSVGLLVGGVGVVGIMMISVTERTREIGVRKALGATKQEILWQFLVEAAVLTLIGGAIGLLGGAALATTVASLTPIPASIPLWSVAAALGMAILTGILFGLIPAYRGSRMEPVDALRYE